MLTQLLLVILIILLLPIFYYFIIYEEPLIINEEIKIATLSNYGTNVIETCIINIISLKNQFYFFIHKDSHKLIQLNRDNRVSVLIYTVKDNLHEQNLLYGKVEPVHSTTNLILYKIIIDNNKISCSKENNEDRITEYNYNNVDSKHIKDNFSEVSLLINEFIELG
jgi:pyridoxine/pyridoxamine 5'-phosphate oxidase